MFYYVDFHSDGGETCSTGRRRFPAKVMADVFADLVRKEPGHSCGPDSVKQFESEEKLAEDGHLSFSDDEHPSLNQEYFERLLMYTNNAPRD